MFLSIILSGCLQTLEDEFIYELNRETCDGNWPVCNTAAGCVLGKNQYIEGSFPSSYKFIINAEANKNISIKILFKNQKHAGTFTELYFYKPGCFDRYSYDSKGKDIFRLAGDNRTFIVEQRLYEEGNHLIELTSDSYTEFLLKFTTEN